MKSVTFHVAITKEIINYFQHLIDILWEKTLGNITIGNIHIDAYATIQEWHYSRQYSCIDLPWLNNRYRPLEFRQYCFSSTSSCSLEQGIIIVFTNQLQRISHPISHLRIVIHKTEYVLHWNGTLKATIWIWIWIPYHVSLLCIKPSIISSCISVDICKPTLCQSTSFVICWWIAC